MNNVKKLLNSQVLIGYTYNMYTFALKQKQVQMLIFEYKSQQQFLRPQILAQFFNYAIFVICLLAKLSNLQVNQPITFYSILIFCECLATFLLVFIQSLTKPQMLAEYTAFHPPPPPRPNPPNNPPPGISHFNNFQLSLWIDDYRPQYLSTSIYDRTRYEVQKSRGCPKNQKQVQKCIGIIRAVWYNHNNQVSSCCAGTGFVVSSRILMACTSTLYSKRLKRFADRVAFLPDVLCGMVRQHSDNIRITSNLRIGQNLFVIKNNVMGGSRLRYDLDHSKPRKESFCLVALPEANRFYYNEYLAIGELPNVQPVKLQHLTIIGYPDKSTSFCEFGKVNIERVQIYCQLDAIQEAQQSVLDTQAATSKQANRAIPNFQVIRHTGTARQGMTGSPILALNSASKLYAVGMQGLVDQVTKPNLGVYFHQAVLNAIQDFQSQIQAQIYIQKEIKYYFFKKKMNIFEIEQESEPENSLVEGKGQQWGECLQKQKSQQVYMEYRQKEGDGSCCSSDMSDMQDIQGLLNYFTLNSPDEDQSPQ